MNEEIKKILDEWGAETVARIIQVMSQQNIKFSGTLQRSIMYQIGEDNIQFLMADYGEFVDKGIGKFGPRGQALTRNSIPGIAFHIKPWATAKGLNNWAVATNIVKRGGIKPRRFFTSVIEEQIANLIPRFDNAIVRYLDDRIEILNQQ